MKSRHVIVSALLAMMAISAMGAASASAALPAFYNTVGVEANPGSFTGTSIHRVTVEIKSVGAELECASDEITGKFINSKELGGTTVTLDNCRFQGRFECGNHGSLTNITSEPLKGTLGYINKETHEVGLRLEAESEKEEGFPKKKVKGPWAAFIRCPESEENVELGGAVIGVIKPVNTRGKKFTTTYLGGGLEQSPAKFEGGVNEHLLWEYGSKMTAVLNGEFSFSFPKEYEIRA